MINTGFNVVGDASVSVAWLLTNFLIAFAIYCIGRRLYPGEQVNHILGHCIVMFWASIVAAGFALSVIGFLLPWALVGAVLVICCATSLALRHCRLPIGGVCEAVAGAKGAALEVASREGARVDRAWLLVWASVFAFWIGHNVVDGLLMFPTDWDDLMYHLPLVTSYIQSGSIYAPDAPRWSDPGNNELIALWLVGPFSGDFLYPLTNIFSAVLLAWAAREVCRLAGASIALGNLGALVIVSNYVVLKQLTILGNDVAVAAAFIAALAYALRYSCSGRGADLALGVVCLGLLSGVKFYALGYAAVIAAVSAPVCVARLSWRGNFQLFVLGSLGVTLFGGYWYLRNWVVGGSPLYPLGRTPSSDEFSGFYPNVWQTTFLGNGSSELLPLLIEAVLSLGGPVHLLGLVACPLVVLWLLLGVWAKGHSAARRMIAAATIGAGLVLAVTPFAVEDVPGTLNQMHWKYCPVRYGMCFLTMAVLALTVVLDDISRLVRVIGPRLTLFLVRRFTCHSGCPGPVPFAKWAFGGAVPALLAVGLAVQIVEQVRAVRAEVVDSLLIAVNVLLIANISRLLLQNRGRFRGALVALVGLYTLLTMAMGVEHISRRWHRGFNQFYDRMLSRGMFDYFAKKIPPGTTICVLDLRPYPFYGPARQFHVCQPGSMRTSYPAWERYLRERRVGLVAARFDLRGNDWCEWLRARPWFAEHPDTFTRIEDSSWPYVVYKVKGGDVPSER